MSGHSLLRISQNSEGLAEYNVSSGYHERKGCTSNEHHVRLLEYTPFVVFFGQKYLRVSCFNQSELSNVCEIIMQAIWLTYVKCT